MGAVGKPAGCAVRGARGGVRAAPARSRHHSRYARRVSSLSSILFALALATLVLALASAARSSRGVRHTPGGESELRYDRLTRILAGVWVVLTIAATIAAVAG